MAIQHITCLYIGRIGDVIVATPFLRSLRRHFDKARIRLVVGPRARSVLPLIPFIDEGLSLGRPQELGKNMALAWALARRPCELLIDLNSSFSKTSTALTRLARAPRSLAFDKGRGPAVFTELLEAPQEREHMSSRYARLAAALGADYQTDLELHVPKEAQAEGDRILAGLGAPEPEAFKILVHPGNITRQPSFWPEARLIELCAKLQADPRLRLYFLCGPGEFQTVSQIARALPRPAPLLPAATLSVVAAMIARMDLLLGSLTSTTHLAAALGTPTFAFYEGYTHAVWQPRGERHGGSVSAQWNTCRSTTVEEAYAALQSHLARLLPSGRSTR